MERRTFEEQMKQAFQKAEVDPSENVWTNVELDLERANGDKMRRRIVFYKLLAAASITFAMCVAGIGYYAINHSDRFGNGVQLAQRNENSDRTLADQSQLQGGEGKNVIAEQSVSTQKSEIRDLKNSNDEINANEKSILAKGFEVQRALPQRNSNGLAQQTLSLQENRTTRSIEDRENFDAQNLLIVPQTTDRMAADDATDSNTRLLPELYYKKTPALVFAEKQNESEADPVAVMFAKLNDLERELMEEKKEKKVAKNEKLWTSVGFAAGGFNTVNSNVSPSPSNSFLMSSSSNVADRQSKASGTVYTAGVSVGTSISNRWVLQGGVNYLTQLSEYTANEALGSADFQKFKAVSINEMSRSSDGQSEKLISTAPYNVNNNVQFISMPVQAGYLIVNKKLGWQFNAGVATDLFLQNTINPQGGGLDKTTQGRGDDSPYRSVNFSGLVGTELSYRVADRYRISLNPGIRYPLNSIYKSDLGIEATPLTFDVGLRFRYIFH